MKSSASKLSALFSLLIILALCSPRIAKAQDWEEKFIQYASNGLDSDSGADVIDFDGDGRLDVVMGSEQRRELQWLDNKGSSITPRVVRDDFSGYFCVKTTDFNQDGFDDFILGASQFNDNRLYLMRNDGSYNYELIEIGFTASTVDNMEVVDLDNDGDLDIVYDDRENNNFLRVWETLENDEFASHQVSFDGQPAYLYGVADLDNDGTLDIMASHYDFDVNDFSILAVENHGDFTWTFHHQAYVENPETGVVGQFSGSDLPDLVQGPQDGEDIGILWENQGNFEFDFSNGIPTSNFDRLFPAGDIDNNGFDDFFAYDFTTCRLVYSGGESNFATEPADFLYNLPMAYVDYNGDGIKDFITHSGRSNIEYVSGSDDFVFSRDYRNHGNGPNKMEIADMNEDGYNDIVTTASKEVYFYLQQFNDVYAKPTGFSIEDEANWISGALTTCIPYDRENDGDLDILVYDSPILMWMINENGEYTADLVSDDAGGWAARVGDIDNDGFADAFVYEIPTKRYEATANGYSTSTVNAGGSYFDLGDYNGDGNEEIIYIEWTDDDEIELRRTSPTGGFTDDLIAVLPQLTFTTNSLDNRTKMVVVDLDQNGYNDVLVSTGEEDLILWVKQFENDVTEVQVINDDVWFPYDIEAADINQDGEIDVAIADRNNRRIVLMYNNGDGSFTNEFLDAHIANPREVELADMNNDGDLDVIYSSARDGKIVVFENGMIQCENSYLSLSETICASDSLEFNGEFISSPGLYTMTLENALMCDSIIGLQLSNFDSEQPVIDDGGLTLSIENNWSNVQWFLEGELIDGETRSSIDVSEYGNGLYSVSGLDNLGCSVLSEAIFATPISIFEPNFTFAMYPNPASEKVKIELGNLSKVNIQLYSSTGVLVREWTNKSGTLNLDLLGVKKGIYEVVVSNENTLSTRTLIKN